MNYLAHAYFSNNEEELLIGNFIADHVRGNALSAYPEGIVRGIRLHREIDSFTDCHPAFRASKRLFYEGFEKYSGILVDIYFDHLLARNFSALSGKDLQVFTAGTYEVYGRHRHLLPASSARFLDYVIKNNIYLSYGTEEGIEPVLFHLSQRIGHGVRLDESLQVFLLKRKILEENFRAFFSDISTHLTGQINY